MAFTGHIDGAIPIWLLMMQLTEDHLFSDSTLWQTAELMADEGRVRLLRVLRALTATLKSIDNHSYGITTAGGTKLTMKDGVQGERNPSATQGVQWSAA